MKKILARITEAEKEEVIRIVALRATYNTLLLIERYEFDKKSIELSILECSNKITDFWSNISKKYNFPLYLNEKYRIDSENNLVYVLEGG